MSTESVYLETTFISDFARCEVPGPAPQGRRVGGIDFGLRNPPAAVWGVHDNVAFWTCLECPWSFFRVCRVFRGF
jgi:hypothetical protein